MIDPGNGIHLNVPFEDYLRIARLNNSNLKHMARSPAHFEFHQTTPIEDTDALLRGRAIHLATFEPERFRSTYTVYDGRRAGKDWDAFEAAATKAKTQVLTKSMYADVVAAAKAVRSSAMAAPFISGGRGEVTICWTHVVEALAGLPGYRIDCKGRIDFVPEHFALADVKSAKSAEPEEFGRQAFNLDYYVAAAWYVDAYERLTGERRPFYLIAVEAKPPHVVQAYLVTDDQLEKGREIYRERLDRLNQCRLESKWPGYATAPMDLVFPAWAADDENDLSELGLDFNEGAST